MTEKLTDNELSLMQAFTQDGELPETEAAVAKLLRIHCEQASILKLIRRIPQLAMQTVNYDCEQAIIEALNLNYDWFPADE